MDQRVEVLADIDRPRGFLVLVDRVRQSYVDLDDPTYLDFEYVQTFAAILATLPPGPLAVTHVGGGGCSFARYIAAVRPHSSQIVLEPDAAVRDLLLTRLPLPPRSGIRVRAVDGRTGIAFLGAASADVIVVDAFDDGAVPAELTTRQFLADLARVLRPAGVAILNLADGPPADYTRRVLAGLTQVLPEAVLAADPAVLKRKRFGNLVVAASRQPLAVDDLARSAARATFPYTVLGGDLLARFVAGALPLTDEDAARSPEPPGDSWRVQP